LSWQKCWFISVKIFIALKSIFKKKCFFELLFVLIALTKLCSLNARWNPAFHSWDLAGSTQNYNVINSYADYRVKLTCGL